jgi:hypothetical protein
MGERIRLMPFFVHKEVRPMAIDKADLDEWRALDDEVAQLKRRIKTIGDRQSQLETLFEAELTASERPSIIRHGFTLAWIRGRASVSWAKEFLRECGAEKVDALKDSAAETVKLSISVPK